MKITKESFNSRQGLRAKPLTVLKNLCIILVLILIIIVMYLSVWCGWNLDVLTWDIPDLELKTFTYVCYPICMEIIASLLSDKVFPNLFKYCDVKLLLHIVFWIYMILGLLAFFAFMVTSINFWTPDILSLRIIPFIVALLMFSSFCFKLVLAP